MGFFKNLSTPAPIPVATHSLADIIVADALQRGYSDDAALGVAAVFRARMMNADIPASLPVMAGGVELTDTHDRVMATILALQDFGDCYWAVDPVAKDWSVIPNRNVEVRWLDTARTERVYLRRGSQTAYRVDGDFPNLVVLSLNRGANDLTGKGWMESDRIAGLLAEQVWSQSYFENNGAPTGIVEVPGNLTKQEADRLKSQWVDDSSAERTPRVLSSGMSWRSTSFNASDSEWVDTHLTGIGDVSALSGVPPFFLAYSPAGSSLTYSTNADLWRMYWAQTLQSTYTTRIEDAWSRVLGVSVEFDAERLLIASLRERAESAGVLIRAGFEPEDVADVTGLPPMRHTGILPVTLQTEDDVEVPDDSSVQS